MANKNIPSQFDEVTNEKEEKQEGVQQETHEDGQESNNPFQKYATVDKPKKKEDEKVRLTVFVSPALAKRLENLKKAKKKDGHKDYQQSQFIEEAINFGIDEVEKLDKDKNRKY